MPKNTCLTNQEIERIKQLYASGKRVVEIIPLVNRPKSAIYKALNQSNINNKMLKKKRGPKGIISKRGTREMERSMRKKSVSVSPKSN